MTLSKRGLLLCGLAGAMLLAGCGGGGGDSGVVPPTTDFNARAAWQNLLLTGGSWVVTGRGSNGSDYEATLTIAPVAGADVLFPPNATTYARTTITSTLKENGVSLGTGVNEYFRDAGLLVRGIRGTPPGSTSNCALATASVLPPTAAKVNASGALMTLNDLTSCTLNAPANGTETATWSIEFERAFVFLCLNSVSRDATNQIASTENDCVQIVEDGTLGTRSRITISFPGSPGFNLVARNF